MKGTLMTSQEKRAVAEEKQMLRRSQLSQEHLNFLEQIPPKYQTHFEKAYLKSGYTVAIKAKCLDCCCWQVEEITNCNSECCPLWLYRPYQK